MKWKIVGSGILLVFLFSSCAAQSQNKDVAADEALGLDGGDQEASAAQQALDEIQKTHHQEHQQQLERQITDPISVNDR